MDKPINNSMLISNQLSQLQLQLSKPDLQKLLQNLQPGQLLKATVLNQVTENSIRLKIGAQELTAYTKLRLEAGQKLTMEVIKGGKKPELQLLQERTNSEVKNQALRQALPKQIPQTKFFNTLQAIERTTPELLQKLLPKPLNKSTSEQEQKSGSQLQKALTALLQKKLTAPSQKPTENNLSSIKTPPNLQKAIQAILTQALPQTGKISAPQIRQSLLNSGLLLEANLAIGNSAQVSGDLKANLLNLSLLLHTYLQSKQGKHLQQANKLPHSQATEAATSNRTLLQLLSELFRQTEGSLARIQTHQLNSLPSEELSAQTWRFELPIQQSDHIDSFLIQLEQEKEEGKKEANTTWKITLNFNFSPLGAIETRLSLKGEEISAVFLAEQATSAVLLSQNLARLNDALTQVGLKVGQLHCQQGKINPLPSTTPSPTTFLLDEKA